jgi:hypothetical protein
MSHSEILIDQMNAEMPTIDIAHLQPSIETSNHLANAIIETVLNGNINPLDLPVKKKCIEMALDQAMKNEKVQEVLIEEIRKHGKHADHFGAKLEVMEAGTKYHYEGCGDTEWEMLDARLRSIKNDLTEREKFLKTVPKDGLIVTDPHTGDTVTIYPPTKTSTTTIKTTMK